MSEADVERVKAAFAAFSSPEAARGAKRALAE